MWTVLNATSLPSMVLAVIPLYLYKAAQGPTEQNRQRGNLEQVIRLNMGITRTSWHPVTSPSRVNILVNRERDQKKKKTTPTARAGNSASLTKRFKVEAFAKQEAKEKERWDNIRVAAGLDELISLRQEGPFLIISAEGCEAHVPLVSGMPSGNPLCLMSNVDLSNKQDSKLFGMKLKHENTDYDDQDIYSALMVDMAGLGLEGLKRRLLIQASDEWDEETKKTFYRYRLDFLSHEMQQRSKWLGSVSERIHFLKDKLSHEGVNINVSQTVPDQSQFSEIHLASEVVGTPTEIAYLQYLANETTSDSRNHGDPLVMRLAECLNSFSYSTADVTPPNTAAVPPIGQMQHANCEAKHERQSFGMLPPVSVRWRPRQPSGMVAKGVAIGQAPLSRPNSDC